MTRSDIPQERPKRCFSWPEEALLTNDEDFIYLPREHVYYNLDMNNRIRGEVL